MFNETAGKNKIILNISLKVYIFLPSLLSFLMQEGLKKRR